MEPFNSFKRVELMDVKKLWSSRPSEHDQFESLIQPHLKQLYTLAYRFSGQRQDAEDLVQDVLLKLFPRLTEMQVIEKLGPWLARVLYRHFVDKLRVKQRAPLYLVGDDEKQIVEDYVEQRPGPARTEDVAILQHQLHRALGQLNEDQRMLVILHDVEGYTLLEIHAMHDVSIGTLKSRLNRARGKLRESLKKVEPFEVPSRVNE